MASLFTIGHSNHAEADFLGLLRRHAATVVVDVRSAPYSRFNPHFNRDALQRTLDGAGIGYVYLGRELGGRSDDPACYRDGRICYHLVAEKPSFKEGLRCLAARAADQRVVMMCAEREPLHCHRTLLVAQALDAEGKDVAHIHADGRLEPHHAAMDRLLESLGLAADDDLFAQPRAELLEIAIRQQTTRVGHVRKAKRLVS